MNFDASIGPVFVSRCNDMNKFNVIGFQVSRDKKSSFLLSSLILTFSNKLSDIGTILRSDQVKRNFFVNYIMYTIIYTRWVEDNYHKSNS